jgi:hypothetical protein
MICIDFIIIKKDEEKLIEMRVSSGKWEGK